MVESETKDKGGDGIPAAFGGDFQDEVMLAAASTTQAQVSKDQNEATFSPSKVDLLKSDDQKQENADEDKEPVWLGDLIHESFYDKLVIIGFPYDEGAKRAGARKGADYGPGKL